MSITKPLRFIQDVKTAVERHKTRVGASLPSGNSIACTASTTIPALPYDIRTPQSNGVYVTQSIVWVQGGPVSLRIWWMYLVSRGYPKCRPPLGHNASLHRHVTDSAASIITFIVVPTPRYSDRSNSTVDSWNWASSNPFNGFPKVDGSATTTRTVL